VQEELNFEQLKKKYLELQLRVTQFSVVEQELINTQDKLDQELVLYKRLNEFNRSALSPLTDNDFSRLCVESIIDILEVEGALVLFYCNENSNKIRFEIEGEISSPKNKLFEVLRDYYFVQDSRNKEKVIHYTIPNEFPYLEIDFSECLYFSQTEKRAGGGIMIISWITEQNAPLYRKISQREKNVFAIFCQQVYSLYINRLKTDKITEQIEQISASQLELKKLSLIATKTKNGVIISNNKGEIEWVNEAFTKITGYPLEEVIGLKPKSFLQSESSDSEKIQLLSQKLANKEEVQVTLINKTKSNQLYYNQLEIVPIFDDDGKHLSFIALQRDITEEVSAKEEILRINSRFEMIAQNAEIGIWESNAKNGNVSWNEILYRQYGISHDEVSDLRVFWLTAIHKDDRKQVEDVIQQIRDENLNKKELTYRIIRKATNEVRYLRCLIMAERNELGELTRLVGSSVDQTEEVMYIQEIENSRKKIERINKNLEKMVHEKTQHNLDLAKTITDQEKLVTIGEIASGIAHDLNTPLGSIKVGAESIRSTLETLFKETLVECSLEQVEFACNRAMNNQFELFVGGLQKRKEMTVLSSALSKINHDDAQNIELLDYLVKCRFHSEEMNEIIKIIENKNRISFLRLIYQLQSLRSFLDTILSSSDRAGKVVQDMRNYIKDNRTDEKSIVQLRENIATVLNIFNYEINRKADIVFQVSDKYFIKGFDIHLFQLWSNLIKNAAESFESEHNGNYIKISAEESDTEVIVHIENNGPMIPEEIQTKIFQKFYTIKISKNGTGLGLSIVKKIIDEHNGKIILSSDENRTIFSIYFPKK